MPGIKIGSTSVKRVVLGDGAGGKTLKRVVLGDGGVGVVLWQDRQVVVITPGSSARDQFRSALAARGLDYTTVKELPFDLDTSSATELSYMFSGCEALTSVPSLDTTNVTGMYSMFSYCSALTTVPQLDTNKVTNMTYMFLNCEALRDGNVKLIRSTKTKPSTRTNMIQGSGLTREPFFLPDGTPF